MVRLSPPVRCSVSLRATSTNWERVALSLGTELVEQIDGSSVWTVQVAGASPNQLVSLYFHALGPNQLDWVSEVAKTLERQ